MSWLEASPYGPLERAKGIRFPPRTAARLASGIGLNASVRIRMTDRYQQLIDTPPGRLLVSQLGLPKPTVLRRHEPGDPLVDGPALVGGTPGSRLVAPAIAVLEAADVAVLDTFDDEPEARFGAIVYDASGIETVADLHHLYEFMHVAVTRTAPSGRVIVLGTPPEQSDSVVDGDRATRARGLRARAGQGAARRRDGQSRLRGTRRRGQPRGHPALLRLRAVRVRRRPGGPDRGGHVDRARRLGAAAGRPRRARHGRLARHRRVDRRDARPRRRPRHLPRHPGGRRDAGGGRQPRRRFGVATGHHR